MKYSKQNLNTVTPTTISKSDTSKSQIVAAKVINVIDGDTIEIELPGGVKEKVRLIGIDTPETLDPRKDVECFGTEASKFMKSLLDNKNVELEVDSTQGDKDKYNRLLRYIYLEDKTNVNLELIRQGFASEYTYDTPYNYQNVFKSAETEAKNNKIGLWGDKCTKVDLSNNSETSTSQTSSITTQATTPPAPVVPPPPPVTPPPPPPPPPSGTGYISGSCKDLNAQGLGNFLPGDPNYTPARDRDNDGIACEM